MNEILQARGLSKTFVLHARGGATIMAFRDLDLDLAQGEFLGVSGPSGIGKSTLLKTIYRTYRADSGTVLYRSASKGEVDLLALDEHDMLELRETEIAYVSQFFQVMPRVSAMGILLSALAHRGLSDAECRERAAAMLERVCLPRHLWELYPSTFSGGEKQRLNIAHALLSSPRLLLLDEPTASLDAAARDNVLMLLAQLKAEGTSMIGIFHDQASLRKLADEEFRFVPTADSTYEPTEETEEVMA